MPGHFLDNMFPSAVQIRLTMIVFWIEGSLEKQVGAEEVLSEMAESVPYQLQF